MYKQYNLIAARLPAHGRLPDHGLRRVGASMFTHNQSFRATLQKVHGFSTATLITKGKLTLNISIMTLKLIIDLCCFSLPLTGVESLKCTRNLPKPYIDDQVSVQGIPHRPHSQSYYQYE